MRALVVRPGPRFSVADVADGWVAGLREMGVEVADFNFDDRLAFYSNAHAPNGAEPILSPPDAARMAAKGLEAVCYEWWPDLVLVISGFFIPPETLDIMRRRGHKVVLVHTESPYEDDRQIPRAAWADLNVVNDPLNLSASTGRPVRLHPPRLQPGDPPPRGPEPGLACDFSFVGTGFPADHVPGGGRLGGHRLRARPATGARRRRRAGQVPGPRRRGVLPEHRGGAALHVVEGSANLYRKEATATADGWAMGPREVELAACGTFFLRGPRRVRLAALDAPDVQGPGEFEDQVRWWLRTRHSTDTSRRARMKRSPDRTFAQPTRTAPALLGRRPPTRPGHAADQNQTGGQPWPSTNPWPTRRLYVGLAPIRLPRSRSPSWPSGRSPSRPTRPTYRDRGQQQGVGGRPAGCPGHLRRLLRHRTASSTPRRRTGCPASSTCTRRPRTGLLVRHALFDFNLSGGVSDAVATRGASGRGPKCQGRWLMGWRIDYEGRSSGKAISRSPRRRRSRRSPGSGGPRSIPRSGHHALRWSCRSCTPRPPGSRSTRPTRRSAGSRSTTSSPLTNEPSDLPAEYEDGFPPRRASLRRVPDRVRSSAVVLAA